MLPSSPLRTATWLPALACCLALATSGGARTALTVEPVLPGSADVVVRWESASTGPFHLVRRDLPFDAPADAALPFDPIVDRVASNVSSPLVLPGLAAPSSAPQLVLLGLVDDAGSCSNVGYVQRIPRSSSSIMLGVPRRGALRTLSSILEQLPDAFAASAESPALPGLSSATLRRMPGGALLGLDVLVPRDAGVRVQLVPGTGCLVLVGAEDPGDAVFAVQGGEVEVRARWSLPLTAAPLDVREVACGREGIDWTDGDGDGNPDDCPGGLWQQPRLDVTHATLGLQSNAPDLGPGAPWEVNGALGATTFDGSPFDVTPGFGFLTLQRYLPSMSREWRVSVEGAEASCLCPDGDGDGQDDCSERLLGFDPADPASAGPDFDRDGVRDDADACPLVPDAAQPDRDGDGRGDACDPCASDASDACADADRDGIRNDLDPCPALDFGDAADLDSDGFGDYCDNCIDGFNPWQEDADGNGVGNVCEPGADPDGDGVPNALDCAPQDSGAFAPPAEATGLRVGKDASRPDPIRLAWDDPAVTQGRDASTDVVGGDLLRLPPALSTTTCIRSNVAGAELWVQPPAVACWFLVRTTNACGASLFGGSRQEIDSGGSAWYCP